MYTTLNRIKFNSPCTSDWQTLLKALGKTKADDEPISMAFILQSNGFDDALWALQCLESADREIRLFAVEVAREVQHLMTDCRSLAALDVAERFANGLATSEELDAARDAARDAAWGAAAAARDAADEADAAWGAAAWAAAAAARDAAGAAAGAAAWEAAGAAARAAARDAARAAARDAAGATAKGAAWGAAWGAARGAAKVKQEEIFLKYFG